MTSLPDAPDGSLLRWNNEDHHVGTAVVSDDGRRVFEYPQSLFVYRDGTEALGSLEVAERVDGRWRCIGCRRVLDDDEDVCACLFDDDRQGPGDPF